MKHVSTILRIISYMCVFLAGAYSIYKMEKDGDKQDGMNIFVVGGLLPVTILAFVRHVFLSGSIIDGGKFFEMEAGGVNLGIAVALIVALIKGAGIECFGYILLIFAIYLLMGLFAHVKYIKKKIGMKVAFVCFIGLLSYYVYQCLV